MHLVSLHGELAISGMPSFLRITSSQLLQPDVGTHPVSVFRLVDMAAWWLGLRRRCSGW